MSSISKDKLRDIVEDFAQEIRDKRVKGAKPKKTVINFRNERKAGTERDIWLVPTNILRYRKDNGRIASDVQDYERNIGVLRETNDKAQDIIARFLEEKDPEKTEVLRQNIFHSGQVEPAIITCDGFLINGNRRKMVMEKLRKEHPQDESFAYMKCVVLPGKDEPGGPPTIVEIEKLENRYQLQSEGKAEYYNFDRALTIKRKMLIGLSLREQLKDDPQYAEANESQLEKAVKKYENDFLLPLQCVDRYLKQFGREGQYRTISKGMFDPAGRWQAFIDYSERWLQDFNNPKRRLELGIDEDEIGAIEEAAFDIIRLRTIPEMPKVHAIMRLLPKYCGTKSGKKEIIKIADEVEPILPSKERLSSDGKPLSADELDAKWAAKNKQPIIHRLKNASKHYESQKDKETPMGLLDAAYKKLTHQDMDLRSIAFVELKNARQLVSSIQERSAELESEIFRLEKEGKKLLRDSR